MYMHTYGNADDPAVLLLHPMGITADKLYEIIGSRFKGEYYILVPDMGNHGMEKSDYISAENEAENICGYLKKHGITDIALLYGASMGAAVALRMISYSEIMVRSLYLDGAPIAKLGFLMTRLFAPVLIWQRGIYEKNDKKKLAEYIERWGDDLNDHMRETFIGFSNTSIRNISAVCVKGNMVAIPEELQRHTYMEWGKDEDFAKTSPKVAGSLYPLAHIAVRSGYNHCEYMMKKNPEYVAGIEKVIEKVRTEGV